MGVLIVDDKPEICEALELLCELHGIEAWSVRHPDEAGRVFASQSVDALILDMNFGTGMTSGADGAAAFRRIHGEHPAVPILLMTAWSELEMAVELIREGATDYIQKPWDDEKLIAELESLFRAETSADFVCESHALQRTMAFAQKAATSDEAILLTGPTGCGKERVAESIQAHSTRCDGPFVRVNVGAIPRDLVISAFFGARAGSFTGATGDRKGFFETADGGTIFMDEIATLSMEGQAALLRILDDGSYHRVGDTQERRVDVRVIAATNQDLRAAVATRTFREDLYYRLAGVEIQIPPLADRPEDIDPLVDYFLASAGHSTEAITETHRTKLRSHDWPGNVRELRAAVRRLVLTGEITMQTAAPPDEAESIRRALLQANGVVAHAAASLGLSRQALYRRMRRLGVSVNKQIER